MKHGLIKSVKNTALTLHLFPRRDCPLTTQQAAADDFYDYNGYGYGENYDGILFYIADYERKYQFSTCGSGETIFNENGLAYLEKKVDAVFKGR